MPSRSKYILSPKLNVEYTVNPFLQIYMKAGKGFHWNKCQGCCCKRGAGNITCCLWIGSGLEPWKPAAHLFINTAVWYLYLQQEFVYDGDDGTLEPGNKTRREGIDFSARYQFNNWLYAFIDVNYAYARDIQAPKGSNFIPLAVSIIQCRWLEL